MSQPKRLGALQKFQAGDREILICTDVASRGLDIPSVDVVIVSVDQKGHVGWFLGMTLIAVLLLVVEL